MSDLPDKEYKRIVDEYMVSEQMREHLYGCTMGIKDICPLICSAPVAIEKKLDDLRILSLYDDESVASSIRRLL